MGQQQSSEKPAEKPSTHRSTTPGTDKTRKINRRVSIQALSHPRAQPVDPSASNTTAVAQATTTHNVEKSNLQNLLQSGSPEPSPNTSQVERSASKASKQRKETEQIRVPTVQKQTQPQHQIPYSHQQQQPTPRQPLPLRAPVQIPDSLPSTSIDIPVSALPKGNKEEIPQDYLAYQERHYAPVSHLRPPRLPLPIADPRVPDSPTLMPIDQGIADIPIFDHDEPVSASDTPLRRRSSFQSEATQEEEEVGDELQPYAVEQPAHTVPTTIEWNQPGERVFVTGTFATWERKYRLHRRKSRDGMYCTINLPPGTHHLKFWVDNQMVTSTDLPTAVDFNNVLVNYIEISADDLPESRRESGQHGTHHTGYSGSYPGQAPPPLEDQDESYSGQATPADDATEGVTEPPKKEMPPGDYRNIIPQYLIDIDYSEDDPRYRQAADIISDGNGPPSLPMFLNRSILNGNTPVKDDSSVLTLPNHTVLNHLMTSSVKNGVLATSVTHRYKKKVTIHIGASFGFS